MYFSLLVLAILISFWGAGLAFLRARFSGRCSVWCLIGVGLLLLGGKQLILLRSLISGGEVTLTFLNTGGELLVALLISSGIMLDGFLEELFKLGPVIGEEPVDQERDLFPDLENGQEFRTLFEAAPDVMGWVDKEGYVRNINRAFEEKFGYKREKIIGSHMTDVSIIADGSIERIKRKHRQRMAGEKVEPYTVKAWDSDGNAHFMELNVFQVKENGELKGNVVTSRDITERREAEQRSRHFRRAIESSEDPIVAIDQECRYLFANQAYREVFPRDEDDLSGRHVREVLGTKLFEGIKHRVERGLNGEKVRYEMARETRGGTVRHYDISYHPLKNRRGEVVGLAGVLKDITERTRYRSKLEATLEEKETLLQEVHHRVKNNMQLISSLLAMQSLHVENEKAQDMLSDSRQRVHSLAQVHEKIYRSGDFTELDFEDYIVDLVQEIRAQYATMSDDVSHHVEVDSVEFGLNRAIYLGLIVNELVTNAHKYGTETENGELQIKVQFTQLDSGYRLLVEDNGPGLPDDFNLSEHGSVGLQLVESLTERQLKGDLEVDDSASGAGFEIWIPEELI